jgi:hypothetical protein
MLWHVENAWLSSMQDETRQADAATSSQSLHASIKRRVPAIPSANKARAGSLLWVAGSLALSRTEGFPMLTSVKFLSLLHLIK